MAVSSELKQKLLTRLRRIEGQTRGLQRMVEEDKYCVDIMNQIAGVQAALEQVTLLLMENHLASCVTDAIHEGQGEEKIREIMHVLKQYMRASRTTHQETMGTPRVPLVAPFKEKDNATLTSSTT